MVLQGIESLGGIPGPPYVSNCIFQAPNKDTGRRLGELLKKLTSADPTLTAEAEEIGRQLDENIKAIEEWSDFAYKNCCPCKGVVADSN